MTYKGMCLWHETGEGLDHCPATDVVTLQILQDGKDEPDVLGTLCLPHITEWKNTHLLAIAGSHSTVIEDASPLADRLPPGTPVFEMQISRDSFPDEETYQKALASSQDHRRYDNYNVTGETISGIPDGKVVDVFRALVAAARPVGMGYLDANSQLPYSMGQALMDWAQAAQCDKKKVRFDYVAGRPIKTAFEQQEDFTWSFDTRLYERDQGNAMAVIEAALNPDPEA